MINYEYMIKFIKIFLIIFFLFSKVLALEYQYILNDDCVENLYSLANLYFRNSDIYIIKDSRGIILRYYFENSFEIYDKRFYEVYKSIENFLAKIENSAIIEVHTRDLQSENLKNWEISTVLANQIESAMVFPMGLLNKKQIKSVGYGEFLPEKNTPNNGGKKKNRVDIIILCNIIGE